ncbi:BTAD domain-containing putative transcriptional regulator [Lentzea sp. NPDC055074]
MVVEYRVLGPLEVVFDGAVVPLPAGRSRVLLATLLLRPNQVVPIDALVDRLWDGEPPTPVRAHKTLHMVVMRLRQALGEADCVRTSTGGYLAEVAADALDLTRFRRLVADGDLAAAVRLWRGPMLVDVRSDTLHQHDVPLVTEEWLHALERRIAADLDTGRAAEVVPELRGLTAQHPFRETFWGQLVLALAMSGQQERALAAYQEIRALLADELGVDPGDDLRAVHQRVLAGPVAAREAAPARGPVPRQLPTTTLRFIGRCSELRDLTKLVGGDGLVVAAITGTAGVGKTALAVHWARGVADRFPDGQLHVNLRGFDRNGEPVAAADVLSRFLEALGVASEHVPADLEARAALYRSLVADRRVLVLLDNARDADQVRPLLPGSAPALVLVTSRNRLTGLVVHEDAHELALDVLTSDEAHALLVSRLDADRVGEADALIKLCGGLPLALAIVAARAAQAPNLPLSALVAELADERTRLDSLDTGDAATSVRTVFQWSYQQLSPAAARLFRLLGVHPGPDVTVPAAASLAGQPLDGTRECLRELVRASLMVEHAAGRFTCHDLLRVYAAGLAEAEESAESRAAALERTLDHHLHTMIGIDLAHGEGKFLLDLVLEPATGVLPERLVDRPAADRWFRAERHVLRAIMVRAQQQQHLDRYAWQLPWFAVELIERIGSWQDWIWVLEGAMAPVTRLGDPAWAARLLFAQSIAHVRLGRIEDGLAGFGRSAGLYQEGGSVSGQVRALNGVAWALTLLGRPREALRVAKDALALQRADASATPERVGMAMHQVASALFALGEYRESLECCAEWEAVVGTAISPAWIGLLMLTKAESYLELGEYDRAIESCHRAIEGLERMGGWENMAITHRLLGDAHHRLCDTDEARRWWTKALEAYEFNQHSNADKVRVKLAQLP